MSGKPCEDQWGRIMRRVKKTTRCWIWQGATVGPRIKYGQGWFQGRRQLVHRIVWQLKNGQIPSEMCVLHKCDNGLCCRPSHLWLGTYFDNTQDRIKKGIPTHSTGTHCLRGHPFSGDNLYVRPTGHQACKTCRRDNQRKHYRARSA